MVNCPICGSPDCIRPAEEVLSRASDIYTPCDSCEPLISLDKSRPFSEMGLKINEGYKKCPVCGRRHLDIVMANVLDILVRNGVRRKNSTLKDTGTPLIKYGVMLVEPPRLGKGELVLIIDNVDKDTSARILREVPEIRGILNRTGNPLTSIGLLDTDRSPHLYELQAGCDMRADIVSSLLGDLVLYRNQGEIHIEFHRNDSIKIKQIEKLYLGGLLEQKVVVDGLACVGTLGILAALGGARKVVLNDAWLPAIRNLLINLEVNKTALGIEVQRLVDTGALPMIADDPVLVARANGEVEIEVYHGDLRKLDKAVPYCDICIIDTFPVVKAEAFTKKWKGLARDRVVTL